MSEFDPKWQISQTATSSAVGRQADIVQARLVLVHRKPQWSLKCFRSLSIIEADSCELVPATQFPSH
jgi:hypothetical protein